MSRPVEQALLSLLPTQNSNLPKPLVELAGSLLAQSRTKASALKAEEEIARTYACANLACDRLKVALDLPPIEPRPPVPPRIYSRLYTYLDKILPDTSLAGRPRATGLGTPRSKTLKSPASRRLPSRGTPTKDVSLSQFRTPSKAGTPSKLSISQSAAKIKNSILPPWIRPTVRHLCTTLASNDGPDIGPTVCDGLETIIAPYRKRTQDTWVNGHLAALVGTIYWWVSMSARLAPGEEVTPEFTQAQYKIMRRKILGALNSARDEVQIPPSASRGREADAETHEALFWDEWPGKVNAADLDEAMREVSQRGWLNSDWYRSIEHLRDKAPEGDAQAEDEVGYDTAAAAAAVQITRTDTMLQDKFDYLSERRRVDYRRWKDDIMRRIEILEREKEDDAMEVDP